VREEPATISVVDELRANRRDSLDRLLPIVYEELRGIAHRHLQRNSPAASLSTTALVHETYVKLVDQSRAGWQDRGHFFALASVAMRHVLINHARARCAQKREGGYVQVTLDSNVADPRADPELLIDIDNALTRLSTMAPRLGRVVELRFYGGLTPPEIAEVLGVTVRTVERDWQKASLLLQHALSP
jgi:RNA polymerase sigma factor (TIGR02999 family)